MGKIINSKPLFKEYDGSWLDRTSSRISWVSWLSRRWWLLGLLLVALNLSLTWLSREFTYEANLLEKPIIFFLIIELLAGLLYLLAVWGLRDASESRAMVVGVLIIGALLRIGTFPSTPILEDDFYRYLWDGAVTANGINPYSYAPGDISNNPAVPSRLNQLAEESSPVAERINHPKLRTIYPPVAQVAFFLAYRLAPWNMLAWRGVLLFFDIITVSLLLMLLRALNLPRLWVSIYWWNPLLIKEVFNSGHMDVIVLPFVLGALLFAIYQKPFWAVGSLALAMGAKLWPIILLPLLIRPLFGDVKRLIKVCSLVGLILAGVFYPILTCPFGPNSGFIAYGQRWEMNDALFMLLGWLAEFLAPANSLAVARIFFLIILVTGIIGMTYRRSDDPVDLCRRSLLAVALLFLLSPAQFPWYYIWMLPLLAIQPHLSLLLLTVTLPLYYLRFFFDARQHADIFDYGIVWLEYLPVCYLLFREWLLSRRRPVPSA
jgi:hypothetical protein